MPHEPFWLDGARCQPYGPDTRRVVIVGRGCLPKAEVLTVRVRVGEAPQEAVLMSRRFGDSISSQIPFIGMVTHSHQSLLTKVATGVMHA